jgi:sulfonate transport system substrate-binding protein
MRDATLAEIGIVSRVHGYQVSLGRAEAITFAATPVVHPSKICRPMLQMGQSRRFWPICAESVYPLIATGQRTSRIGRFVPEGGGEAPPIFAQAAGTPLLYIGYVPDGPKSEAILVPKDSPIKTVADLKGKKVGLNKGSNVHYLLVRVLEKAGLKYSDVEPAFLPPAEGRAAFEKGVIDAWVIWEPYRTAAEMAIGARTLADGTGLVSNNDFFFVAKPFALAHPQLIDLVFGATRDVFAQAAKDIPGTAKTFSAAAGFPVTVLEATLSHRGFDVRPISSEVIDEQQRIADTFKEIGLIPATIKVSDAVHKSGS